MYRTLILGLLSLSSVSQKEALQRSCSCYQPFSAERFELEKISPNRSGFGELLLAWLEG